MSFFWNLAYEFISGVTLGLFWPAQKSIKTQKKSIKKYSKPITKYQPRYFAPTPPPSRTQSIYNNYTKEELERSMKNAEKFRNLTF